jgi:hypothetical protein
MNDERLDALILPIHPHVPLLSTFDRELHTHNAKNKLVQGEIMATRADDLTAYRAILLAEFSQNNKVGECIRWGRGWEPPIVVDDVVVVVHRAACHGNYFPALSQKKCRARRQRE